LVGKKKIMDEIGMLLMALTSPDSWTNAGSRTALESLEAVTEDAAAVLV
jgi:hypothetical protein